VKLRDTLKFTRRAALGTLLAATALVPATGAMAEMLDVEKDELTFGFIKADRHGPARRCLRAWLL
jgi:nitrate/nitrite transport system substrate-binding protein